MLTHPTVDKLHELRCTGMAKAMAEQLASPQVQNLSFEERLGLLVDRELTERHSRQLTNRLRRARLRHDACIEDTRVASLRPVTTLTGFADHVQPGITDHFHRNAQRGGTVV